MHKLYPHLPRPHIAKVQLAEAPTVQSRPSWLQMAAGGFDPKNPVHVATAALRMKTDVRTAARRLESAHYILRHYPERFDGALRLACRESGAVLRGVPVCDAKPAKHTSQFLNGRRMGVLGEQPIDAEIAKMPVEEYVDDRPRDPLRKQIEIRHEAIAAGRL
jgi:hypothetical protein